MKALHVQRTNPAPTINTPNLSNWCAGFLLALGLLFSSPLPSSAETWDPQSLELIPGSATGVICDSAGAVYISGQLKEQQGSGYRYRAAVLKSSDLGETWVAAYPTPASSSAAAASAITCTKVQLDASSYQEQLFIAAWSNVTTAAGTVRGWEVHRSTDAGATWTAITNAPVVFGYYSQNPESIATDSAGNVYVAGFAEERVTTKKSTVTYQHFLVLKGTRQQDNNGESYMWSLVSDIRGTANLAVAFGITCIGTDVFVAGTVDNVWLVRKSSDGGATWAAIDQFQLQSGQAAQAFAITSDAAGNLIVAGRASRSVKGGSQMSWLVRKGTQQANSFVTIDPGTVGMQALGLVVDPTGAVQVVGYLGAGVSWAAREGEALNGAWTWTTSDQHGTNSSAVVNGIACDTKGNLFAAGYSQNSSGNGAWLVRRRLVPTVTP